MSTLLSEATRDVASGTARAVTFGAIFALTLLLLLASDVFATQRLIDDAARFTRSGAATLAVASSGNIAGEACEALSSLPQVSGSGAIRATQQQLTFAVMPRSPLDAYAASSGMRDVLGVRKLSERGIVVSADAADELGTLRNDTVITNRGVTELAGEYDYPADGRRPGFGWAALIPAPADELYDECWVTVWPFTSDIRPLLMSTLAASAPRDAKVEIAQLNTRYGSTFDGAARYDTRPTALNPLYAAALGLVLAFAAIRLRKLEFAARLHDGASTASLQALAVTESLSWLSTAALASAAIAAALAVQIPHPDSGAVIATSLTTCFAAIVGGVCGALTGATVVREQDLFAYFKDR
ncbi:hypothetical protein [Microbacterium bovistercoris]|uniref:hypothetical protein n=1 Tax=Microbacterium bovistercoris TaxID=2293570 RepID=UPI0011C040B2|nr:hypothetical protein [Microbacterium bovistercoris]